MSSPHVEMIKRLQPDGVDLVTLFSEDGEGLVSKEDEKLFDDAFEVRFIAEAAGANDIIGRGVEGLTETWRDWLTPWKSYRLDSEEFIDAGRDVVVFVRIEGETERDSVVVRHAPAAIWRFSDEGKIVAIHFYLNRAEALEAAGLPSEEFAHKTQ
jgi:ketosteroid isomerase-like protein